MCALFRKTDFSLGRGAKWGAQMPSAKPICGHTRAGARPPWHIPGDHIDLVPYLVPVGVLVNPCPTPCLGDAWAPGDDLEIFPPSPWYPVPLH